MAGHSHWAGIKHKKAIADKKKGAAFSKHAKLITTAARLGGGDPAMNLRLAYAVEKARADNMPKDNIERAIKKGTGELEGQSLDDATYEAYAPGGVALLIECITDNRNRTGPELRSLLEKRGGRLGESGSVSWMFERKALVALPTEGVDEDRLTEVVADLGGDDIQRVSESFYVIGDPSLLGVLRQGLNAAGFRPERSDFVMNPRTKVPVDRETAEKILTIVEELEAHDDVQGTHSNMDIPDDVLQELQKD